MPFDSLATHRGLDTLLASHPQLIGVLLVSPDGLLLEARAPTGVDADALAAVIASWAGHFLTPDAGGVPSGGCTLHVSCGQIILAWTVDGQILAGLAEHHAPTDNLLQAFVSGDLSLTPA